jgi:hypothetical protein
MANGTFCGNCGEPIATDDPSGDPAKRIPCPKCGSTSRAFHESRTLAAKEIYTGYGRCILAKATCTAYGTFTPYCEILLQVARDLIDREQIYREQYGMAIIFMHVACEVSAARAFSKAFSDRGISGLEKPVVALMRGFNLATPRIREVYNALTGRNIQSEPFWMKFKESAHRRNSIVHTGKIATQAEAEESYKATSALVAYLK